MPIFSSVQLQLQVQTYWANLGSLFLAVDYSTDKFGKLSSMCEPKILMTMRWQLQGLGMSENMKKVLKKT